jgi:hypothetical protein
VQFCAQRSDFNSLTSFFCNSQLETIEASAEEDNSHIHRVFMARPVGLKPAAISIDGLSLNVVG